MPWKRLHIRGGSAVLTAFKNTGIVGRFIHRQACKANGSNERESSQAEAYIWPSHMVTPVQLFRRAHIPVTQRKLMPLIA